MTVKSHLCLVYNMSESSTYLTPPCNPPPPGGERSRGPKSIENIYFRHRRRQRKFLQGAEADLNCATMVQFCVTPPPPRGGTVTTLVGRLQGGRKAGYDSLYIAPVYSGLQLYCEGHTSMG